jgi:hypothetical protein
MPVVFCPAKCPELSVCAQEKYAEVVLRKFKIFLHEKPQ